VKYNLAVTFCSGAFIMHTPGGKIGEHICTINGLKGLKSAKDMPFGGFVKNFYPTLLAPNSENFALQKLSFAQKI